MPQNKSFNDVVMDRARMPRDSVPVTATQTQAFKDGKVLTDDGNAYDTVQGAVDAAASWVKIPPVTFNESVDITTDGLTVEGSGYNTHINSSNYHGINLDTTNVLLYNISITGGEPSTGTTYNGITCSNTSSKLKIDSVTIRDAEDDGMAIRGNNIINNCTFETTGKNSIYCYGSGAETIINNIIILNNRGEAGIIIEGDDVVVSNSYIQNVNNDGIFFYTGNDCIGYGNRVHNAGRDGIATIANDCILVNNRVSDSGQNDVRDGGTGNIVQDNLTGSAN